MDLVPQPFFRFAVPPAIGRFPIAFRDILGRQFSLFLRPRSSWVTPFLPRSAIPISSGTLRSLSSCWSLGFQPTFSGAKAPLAPPHSRFQPASALRLAQDKQQ